jgi:hypothetical protein
MVASSFPKNSQGPRLEDATLTNGYFLQNETGPPIKEGPLLIADIIIHFKKKAREIDGYLVTVNRWMGVSGLQS